MYVRDDNNINSIGSNRDTVMLASIFSISPSPGEDVKSTPTAWIRSHFWKSKWLMLIKRLFEALLRSFKI